MCVQKITNKRAELAYHFSGSNCYHQSVSSHSFAVETTLKKFLRAIKSQSNWRLTINQADRYRYPMVTLGNRQIFRRRRDSHRVFRATPVEEVKTMWRWDPENSDCTTSLIFDLTHFYCKRCFCLFIQLINQLWYSNRASWFLHCCHIRPWLTQFRCFR